MSTNEIIAEGQGMADSRGDEQTAGPVRPASTCGLWELTGGEPLLQPNVHPLMTQLCDSGRIVLIETSGACDISTCDPRVIRIVDFKTPGSGESAGNDWNNIARLGRRDEIKFVITNQEDYVWAREAIAEHQLDQKAHAVLLSPATAVRPGLDVAGCSGLSLPELAEWILADNLPVRLQTQLHKFIWHPAARGV